MLREQKETVGLNAGGRPIKNSAEMEPVSNVPTLSDIGIDKKLSSRAQQIAAVPEDAVRLAKAPGGR